MFQLLTLSAFNTCSTKSKMKSRGCGVRRWEQGWEGSLMSNLACQLVNSDVYETFTIIQMCACCGTEEQEIKVCVSY